MILIKTSNFFGRINVILKDSFIVRFVETKGQYDLREILENSNFLKWLLKIYIIWRKRVTCYLTTSFILKHIVRLKNELYVFPLKVGSIIVVTAILTNVLLYILFKDIVHKEIGLWGWIIRGILLFIGFAGIFCKIGPNSLIETSLFLKYLRCDVANHNNKPQ